MAEKRAVLERLAAYAAMLAEAMPSLLPWGEGVPQRLAEAMSYSLMAGGKRIRPALCLAWHGQAGGEPQSALPFALGIEMIHSYSLIHDDLPAMDNDDWRRGRPANHKAYGEATAILAGDGLLTDAFSVCLKTRAPAAPLILALRELAAAAGSPGMVGGQMLDIQAADGHAPDMDGLVRMQKMKTGAMLGAACACGALLCPGASFLADKAREYGESLGLAFQITDDILDVAGDAQIMGKPTGSDAKSGKMTWPRMVGMDASVKAARQAVQQACDALAGLEGPHSEFLRDLALYTAERSF